MLESLSPWSVARACKFLGVALLLLGLGGVVVAPARETRLRAAYGLVVPGFLATFCAGWLLLKLGAYSLRTPWLLAGALAGVGALHAGFIASHRPRPSAIARALAWASIGAALTVMSLRAHGAGEVAVVGMAGAVLGGLAARPFVRGATTTAPTDEVLALRGLRWLARLEGASWVLLLVAMGVRHAWAVRLDGGTGLLGWAHGMLLVAFFHSLTATRRMLGWPATAFAAGAVAALVPGAALWFERAWLRSGPPTRGGAIR